MAEQSGAYPENPASTDDIRSLRRWLVVVGVWAVAASAIGIIALINANHEKSHVSSQTNARIGELERTLSGRIQALQGAVSKAAKPSDLAKLDTRLKALSKDVTDAKDASDKAKSTADDQKTAVDDLGKRVDALEKKQSKSKSP